MKKIFYYYDRKYPDYPIQEMIVSGMSYILDDDGDKSLYCLKSKHDIDNNVDDEFLHNYYIHTSYNNEKMLFYSSNGRCDYVLSEDKESIEKWYIDDCKDLIDRLEKRLNMLKENISDE